MDLFSIPHLLIVLLVVMVLRNGVKSGWVIHRQIKMTGSHTEAALSRLRRDYTLR